MLILKRGVCVLNIHLVVSVSQSSSSDVFEAGNYMELCYYSVGAFTNTNTMFLTG